MSKESSNAPYLVRVGRPGKYDPVFCLEKIEHELLSESLYAIVFKYSGERIVGVGSFINPVEAEWYIAKHRLRLIDEQIEKDLLG